MLVVLCSLFAALSASTAPSLPCLEMCLLRSLLCCGMWVLVNCRVVKKKGGSGRLSYPYLFPQTSVSGTTRAALLVMRGVFGTHRSPTAFIIISVCA